MSYEYIFSSFLNNLFVPQNTTYCISCWSNDRERRQVTCQANTRKAKLFCCLQF